MKSEIKVGAIAAATRLQKHDQAPAEPYALRTLPAQDGEESTVFDETLDAEQRRHVAGEADKGQQAARSRLLLLAQSVELLGERLLGASLPTLLHASADLMWMAQELLWVAEDLAAGCGRLEGDDAHACRAVRSRLGSACAFIEQRSGRQLEPAFFELLAQLARLLR
jgi:hypothetical protein